MDDIVIITAILSSVFYPIIRYVAKQIATHETYVKATRTIRVPLLGTLNDGTPIVEAPALERLTADGMVEAYSQYGTLLYVYTARQDSQRKYLEYPHRDR